VVVEPKQRGRHLRLLVGVVDDLRLAGAEPVRSYRWVAVARGRCARMAPDGTDPPTLTDA
jgi:hypothetical protein